MKKFGDESGQTLVMVALTMAVLLGFTGFATDMGVMLHEKRAVQSAADSAAIATAESISSHHTTDQAKTAGVDDAAVNGFTQNATDSNGNVVTTVTIYTTPNDGHFAGDAGYVEAVITQQTPTFFMRLFGQSALTIKGRAVATYLGTGTACGWITNPKSSNPAGNPWGNSTISAPTCGILFNGNLTLGASDAVSAGYIGTTGTITGPQHITGTYETNIPGFTDPLYWLSGSGGLPTDNGNGTCTAPTAADGTTTACYLNQPLVNGSNGQIPDGVYFYNNPTKATYTGAVVGKAVTIVLTNGSLLSSSGGSGKGNASLTLTAPATGYYSGIVLDAPTYTGELDLDFGATVATFNGAVYAPQADLSLQDQGANGKTSTGFGLTINGAMVLGTLDVGDKNKGNLALNGFSNNVPSPIPRISLVE